MSSSMRQTLDTILPQGSFWRVKPDGDLDKIYDGVADNWEGVRSFLSDNANLRNPQKTEYLDDLEREFGVLKNTSLTEQQRRDNLAVSMFRRDHNGSIDDLQAAINAAGFDATVFENSPAADPAIFLDQVFVMVANGSNAYAGGATAYAGRTGGELIVNGEARRRVRVYTAVAGTFTSGDGTTAGEYTSITKIPITYQIPTDQGDWPLVFFVGDSITLDGSGKITHITPVNIPSELRTTLISIILKYKPIHSWCGLIATYV